MRATLELGSLKKLHEKLVQRAAMQGMSLNSLIVDQLQKKL
jgi:predicted HicB family RNase H-like nuclease